jgi:hypothetical protein
MLIERLKARCKTAILIGSAHMEGYKIIFTKRSVDGSGKATLVNTGNKKSVTFGVLFEIDVTEEQELNEIEKGYIADNTFSVVLGGKIVTGVKTYTAPENNCEEGLPVYDWYLALVIAGCHQHKLDKGYISEMIEKNIASEDLDDTRKTKIEALEILRQTGFDKVFSELKY